MEMALCLLMSELYVSAPSADASEDISQSQGICHVPFLPSIPPLYEASSRLFSNLKAMLTEKKGSTLSL